MRPVSRVDLEEKRDPCPHTRKVLFDKDMEQFLVDSTGSTHQACLTIHRRARDENEHLLVPMHLLLS